MCRRKFQHRYLSWILEKYLGNHLLQHSKTHLFNRKYEDVPTQNNFKNTYENLKKNQTLKHKASTVYLTSFWKILPTYTLLYAICTVQIKLFIFQGDALSPLLFILSLAPLSHLLINDNQGFRYEMYTKRLSISHLLFVDAIKLYTSTEKDLKN